MVAGEKQGTRSNSKDLHRGENDGSKTTQTEKGSTALVIMHHVADFFPLLKFPPSEKKSSHMRLKTLSAYHVREAKQL